jgi:hypothetical protein
MAVEEYLASLLQVNDDSVFLLRYFPKAIEDSQVFRAAVLLTTTLWLSHEGKTTLTPAGQALGLEITTTPPPRAEAVSGSNSIRSRIRRQPQSLFRLRLVLYVFFSFALPIIYQRLKQTVEEEERERRQPPAEAHEQNDDSSTTSTSRLSSLSMSIERLARERRRLIL